MVIADHFLSDKSGAEIAAEMKEIKPQVPILIVSGAEEAPKGLEFADGFLSKLRGPGCFTGHASLLFCRQRATTGNKSSPPTISLFCCCCRAHSQWLVCPTH